MNLEVCVHLAYFCCHKLSTSGRRLVIFPMTWADFLPSKAIPDIKLKWRAWLGQTFRLYVCCWDLRPIQMTRLQLTQVIGYISLCGEQWKLLNLRMGCMDINENVHTRNRTIVMIVQCCERPRLPLNLNLENSRNSDRFLWGQKRVNPGRHVWGMFLKIENYKK